MKLSRGSRRSSHELVYVDERVDMAVAVRDFTTASPLEAAELTASLLQQSATRGANVVRSSRGGVDSFVAGPIAPEGSDPYWRTHLIVTSGRSIAYLAFEYPDLALETGVRQMIETIQFDANRSVDPRLALGIRFDEVAGLRYMPQTSSIAQFRGNAAPSGIQFEIRHLEISDTLREEGFDAVRPFVEGKIVRWLQMTGVHQFDRSTTRTTFLPNHMETRLNAKRDGREVVCYFAIMPANYGVFVAIGVAEESAGEGAVESFRDLANSVHLTDPWVETPRVMQTAYTNIANTL